MKRLASLSAFASVLLACGASFVGSATEGHYEPVDCHDGTFCPDPAFPQCPPFVPPGKPRPPCEAVLNGGPENETQSSLAAKARKDGGL